MSTDFVITAAGDVQRVQQSESSGYAALQGSLAVPILGTGQALIMPTWESNWLERQLHTRDLLLKHTTGKKTECRGMAHSPVAIAIDTVGVIVYFSGRVHVQHVLLLEKL